MDIFVLNAFDCVKECLLHTWQPPGTGSVTHFGCDFNHESKTTIIYIIVANSIMYIESLSKKGAIGLLGGGRGDVE